MSDTDETVGPVAEPAGLAYTRVSTGEQRDLIETRLRNLEIEHFQHDSNAKVGESSGNADLVRESRAAMVVIEQAHAELTTQAAALKD